MSQVSDVGQGRKIGSPGLCDGVMFPVWEASGGGRVVTSLGRRKQFNKKNTYLGNDLPEFETNEEIVFPTSFQRENHFH